MGSPEGTEWSFDCPLIDDTSAGPGFFWIPPPPSAPSDSFGVETLCPAAACSYGNEAGVNKRQRTDCCMQPSSKACKEKQRRDRLNERFLELGSILEPGKTSKIDKTAILNDAIRVVTELRSEAQKLKESNQNLQEKIKELKAEKNELREEKLRLKGEKEGVEGRIKMMNACPPSLLTQPPVIPAAFAAAGQGQTPGQKMVMPIIGYPGYAMWQFMPPVDADASQDLELRAPVA